MEGDYFMSTLTSFLKKNAIQVENEKVVVSKRFVEPVLDKNGKETGKTKPVEWEIKAIDTALDEQIRNECTKKVPITGKRGQYNRELDSDKYLGRLCAVCTVFPNLNSAELQDDYGVKSGDELLKAMLTTGEYIEFKAKIMEINGFDISTEELIDEAKN